MLNIGRILLIAAGGVLFATAALHAGGVAMIDGWTEGMEAEQRTAFRFVWLSDSFDWSIAATGWLLAAWRRSEGWRKAGFLLTAIPAAGAAGVISIDPGFFGGHLLLASTLLAITGLLLLKSSAKPFDHELSRKRASG